MKTIIAIISWSSPIILISLILFLILLFFKKIEIKNKILISLMFCLFNSIFWVSYIIYAFNRDSKTNEFIFRITDTLFSYFAYISFLLLIFIITFLFSISTRYRVLITVLSIIFSFFVRSIIISNAPAIFSTLIIFLILLFFKKIEIKTKILISLVCFFIVLTTWVLMTFERDIGNRLTQEEIERAKKGSYKIME